MLKRMNFRVRVLTSIICTIFIYTNHTSSNPIFCSHQSHVVEPHFSRTSITRCRSTFPFFRISRAHHHNHALHRSPPSVVIVIHAGSLGRASRRCNCQSKTLLVGTELRFAVAEEEDNEGGKSSHQLTLRQTTTVRK